LFFGFWCFFGGNIVHAEDGQGNEYLRKNKKKKKNIRLISISILSRWYVRYNLLYYRLSADFVFVRVYITRYLIINLCSYNFIVQPSHDVILSRVRELTRILTQTEK
jgi:hypothetical protein